MHKACKNKPRVGRELLVLCLRTGLDTSLQGALAGSQPRMWHREQRALALLCPGLPKDLRALSCIPPVPWYATAVPVPAVMRAEGTRGLARSPSCLPWGCPAVGVEQPQPRDAAWPRPNTPSTSHILVTHGICVGNTLPKVSDVSQSYVETWAGRALLFLCCAAKGICFLEEFWGCKDVLNFISSLKKHRGQHPAHSI